MTAAGVQRLESAVEGPARGMRRWSTYRVQEPVEEIVSSERAEAEQRAERSRAERSRAERSRAERSRYAKTGHN
ncbi:hypothetical protein GCM10010435_19470 [Winogradskya consettensis]|uniref:Uncharacterized protein n=1 Tax=Winogradskya consettensis TaxID=113560 RepID=A0A919STW8_9ACTN|nr:hypothetical protein Aco04nite_59580 [Actinoplanes consettensis]